MSIIKAINKAYQDKEKRNWQKIYIFCEIHGTILKPNYEYGNISDDFYPYAKETLQLLSQMPEVVLATYTCSHLHEIEGYMKIFKENHINFQYINTNPEVETQKNGYGCYDTKPYFNVLLEDKAGFDPEVDWKNMFDLLNGCYKYGHDVSFNKWREDNRWFNYDFEKNKWCYTFEMGTSMNSKSYEKNYMKTLDELYTIYCNENNKNSAR